MNEFLPINFNTRVLIKDHETGEVLLDKSNAIHKQNMARVIARALANEPNSQIFAIAFGNGGSFQDGVGNLTFNSPNVTGWDSRLHNEVYREICDETSANFGSDPGSADSSNIRVGGAANPENDPDGGGVTSLEVGTKSNIIISVVNQTEPNGQLLTDNLGVSLDEYERCFLFDEIGLYTAGKPARATNGYTTIDVGNKTADDYLTIDLDNDYSLEVIVDGVYYVCELRVPGTGSGPLGEVTYGDLCEGINSGEWIVSGTQIQDYIFAYITDYSGGTYPTIVGKQSYGFLTFESRTTGDDSSVEVTCDSGDAGNFFNVLTGGLCANCNITQKNGEDAGVANDPVNPENERERLLTHFVFSPLIKSENRIFSITYTITVSVGDTSDAQVNVSI